MTPYLLRPDGSTDSLVGVPSVEEAQVLVGGYVERILPLSMPTLVFLVDEDGKRKNKPCNVTASAMHGGLIVGDVVVLTKREAKGEWL